MAPWKGPRHRTWAANTNVATIALGILFLTWLIWEIVGTAPPALSQLLGPTSGIWFGAVASDQRKKQEDVRDTANRAEDTAMRLDSKLDRLKDVAEREHPGSTAGVADPDDKPGDVGP